MTNSKVKILSTRPIGDAMKREAHDHNIMIDEISFISTEELTETRIRRRIYELSKQEIAVVFTSMNAVKAVSNYISGKTLWHIYCIGYTTRKQVENTFSKENISGTAENAGRLAKKIIEAAHIKDIIFFSGDLRRDELPIKLKYAGIAVEELIVYKTILTPQTLTKQYDGILFFSPSAVESFFSKNRITNQTKIFAIGATTAEAAMTHTKNPIIISEFPAKKNLVLLMIKHFADQKITDATVKERFIIKGFKTGKS
jgi:uroporphyrinogen-III synthase